LITTMLDLLPKPADPFTGSYAFRPDMTLESRPA